MAFGTELTRLSHDIPLVVVTGTHLAGKSTVIEEMIDAGIVIPEAPDRDPKLTWPKIRRYGNVLISFVPEAMTEFMRQQNDPTAPTTGYTLSKQCVVENQNLGMIMDGFYVATEAMKESDAKFSAVVCDRSMLDGSSAYRKQRLRNKNRRRISTQRINNDVYGEPGNTSGIYLDYDTIWRSFLAEYCDLALVADHTQIPYISDETRVDDVQFREDIYTEIVTAYTETLGPNKVVHLQGSREERTTFTLDRIFGLMSFTQ